MAEPVEKSTLSQQRVLSAWVFLAPMLAVLAVVAVYPLVKTIYFGFTDASIDFPGQAQWVGFRNYLEYLDYGGGEGEYYGLLADPDWWQAVWNTLRFTFFSVLFETIFGMIIALVLNTQFFGRSLVRAAVLIPWAIPTIVSAKMWAWMMHDQFGILNDMLMKLHIIAEPVAWTADPDTAMLAVLIVDIWKTTPFMALLILAGLQMVPKDMYEAAKLDGIHPVRVFRKVTLPLIMPAVLVAIVFRALDALRVFDIVYVLTPNNANTATMSVFARENLFDFDRFAYGSAASTLLFLIIALLTIGFIRATRMNLGGDR
ncbi:carbohydrate ABC transporter permease [Martelella radicis]|uniref:Trehalose/maltose transport system permease protein n=1 Tax=Martelella radicis TaxID=1397476 RepID=A0A7W6KND9_9HYPH|nr:sugar ABC transporter permease [Martelella radicis]MBB4124412.1 trehalose/maltose transport system permease protein [Martelella radicis]